MSLHLGVVALTHRGGIRTANEDCLLVGGLTASEVDLAEPLSVRLPVRGPVSVALADGMGGHSGGQVASRSVVDLLATAPVSRATPEAVRHRLGEIDADLAGLAARRTFLAEMGTTVCGVVVEPDAAVWFSVGDSRVFLERDGYLAQLSTDDTAPAPDGKGPLTAWLGPRDHRRPPVPGTDILECGDDVRWLLCTDGLSDLVEISEMEDILRGAPDDTTAVTGLFEAAMTRGGTDNISIVLVRHTTSEHDRQGQEHGVSAGQSKPSLT